MYHNGRMRTCQISCVPSSVPKREPKTINLQPTPTKDPIKNGPEIINFRPVLESPLALANRRLQPLGHLTAARNLSIRHTSSYAELRCPPRLSLKLSLPTPAAPSMRPRLTRPASRPTQKRGLGRERNVSIDRYLLNACDRRVLAFAPH